MRVNPVAPGDKLVTLPRRAPRAPPRPNPRANAESKPPQCRRWRVAWKPQARAFSRSSARQLHAPPAYRQNATPRRAPINPRSCAEPQCRLCARTRRANAPNTTRAVIGAEYAASSRKVALIGAETSAPPASTAPAAAANTTNALTRQDCAAEDPQPHGANSTPRWWRCARP